MEPAEPCGATDTVGVCSRCAGELSQSEEDRGVEAASFCGATCAAARRPLQLFPTASLSIEREKTRSGEKHGGRIRPSRRTCSLRSLSHNPALRPCKRARSSTWLPTAPIPRLSRPQRSVLRGPTSSSVSCLCAPPAVGELVTDNSCSLGSIRSRLFATMHGLVLDRLRSPCSTCPPSRRASGLNSSVANPTFFIFHLYPSLRTDRARNSARSGRGDPSIHSTTLFERYGSAMEARTAVGRPIRSVRASIEDVVA